MEEILKEISAKVFHLAPSGMPVIILSSKQKLSVRWREFRNTATWGNDNPNRLHRALMMLLYQEEDTKIEHKTSQAAEHI
jgi:hypothetical protein